MAVIASLNYFPHLDKRFNLAFMMVTVIIIKFSSLIRNLTNSKKCIVDSVLVVVVVVIVFAMLIQHNNVIC
jgi:hypothetical protein